MSEIITNVNRRPKDSTSLISLVQTQVHYYAVLMLKVYYINISCISTLSGKHIIKYQKNFSWENFKS